MPQSRLSEAPVEPAPAIAGPRARARRLARAGIALPLAPSLERRRLQVYLVLLIGDALAIVAGFLLAGYLYLGEWLDPVVVLEVELLVPIYWTVAIANNAYSAEAALDARRGAARAALAVTIGATIVVFLAYFLKASETFSRVISAVGTSLSLGLLVIVRDQLVRFARWRCGPTALNQLVICDGGAPIDLPHAYRIDAREHGLVPDIADPHALNRLGLFLTNMDRVIVTSAPERRAAWAMALKGVNIQAEIVDEAVAALGAIGARRTPEYSALVIAIGPLGLRNRLLKRALDLGVALTALALLAPVLLLVALAIKLEGPGPVLFTQRRLGRGNRFFRIYKFRSMRGEHVDGAGARSTARDDHRITRVGRLIRATSIDELPQLINVIKGEMSPIPCLLAMLPE